MSAPDSTSFHRALQDVLARPARMRTRYGSHSVSPWPWSLGELTRGSTIEARFDFQSLLQRDDASLVEQIAKVTQPIRDAELRARAAAYLIAFSSIRRTLVGRPQQ